MKPYGKKPEFAMGKNKGHTSDNCDICSNKSWKVSKTKTRNNIKQDLKRLIRGEEIDEEFETQRW